MKRGYIAAKSRIRTDVVAEGQSLEETLRKALSNKEPIVGNAKLLYTERKDGVNPMCDIRTDRQELAMLASDRVHASNLAKRMQDDGFTLNDYGQWVEAIKETPKEQQS